MEALSEKLTKYPVVSKASIGIILAGIEQLLALQFACPCDGLWRNRELTAAVFIIPTIMILAISLIMEGFKLDGAALSIIWAFVSVTTPIVIWLMLMFLDGRFFTCAMTDWEGRYVELDGADPQRWCEPNNSSLTCLDDDLEPPLGCMLKTQEFFVTSQWIGLGLLFYLCLILVLHLVNELTKPKAGGTLNGDVEGNNSTKSRPVTSTPSVPVASTPPPVPVACESQSLTVASRTQFENPMYAPSAKDDSNHNETSPFLPTEDTSTCRDSN